MSKQAILQALRAFARQRPGLEFGNYGDVRVFRAEMRSIGRDLRDAQTMLSAIGWRDSITADQIIEASRRAFHGRLSLEVTGDKVAISYCTGQYWPTEYRRAVAAVCAQALWDYWRANGCDTADAIRKTARDTLGRGIASRYFQ